MSNYTTLIGAEDVRSAGGQIHRAAEQMQSAAMTFDSVMERHQRFLDDWLLRFEQMLERERFGRDEAGYRQHLNAKKDQAQKNALRGTGKASPPVDDRVRKLIANMTGFEVEKITDTASWLDLNCDSLDTVELVVAFEEEFGIEVPDNDAEMLVTVGDAIRYIEKAKGGDRG